MKLWLVNKSKSSHVVVGSFFYNFNFGSFSEKNSAIFYRIRISENNGMARKMAQIVSPDTWNIIAISNRQNRNERQDRPDKIDIIDEN